MFSMDRRANPRPWTESESAFLAANYEHVPTMEIARKLGRRHATIREQADRLGLLSAKRRAHASVRHDYFTSMDRPVKAYVLGVLASDGSIAADPRNEVRLEVKDAELTERIREQLAPEAPLFRRKDGRTGLRITSAQMKRDLAALGVTPQKSLALLWPAKLPERLNAPFILGLFDGDGSLSVEKARRYYRWSLVSGSSGLLDSVARKLWDGCGVRPRGPYKTGRAWQIIYCGPYTSNIELWLNKDVRGLARKRIYPSLMRLPRSPGVT